MTVSNTNTKDKFTTNGVTVDFPFTFYLTNTQQVFAKLVDAQGDETDYTNFTVVKNPDNNGGTLTTNDALDNTDLLIFRDTQQTQETDYIPGGRFPAESHEQALDKLTLINQEQQEELDRSLKSKISDEAPPVFNPEGEGILQLENGEVGVSVLTVDEAISISENAQFFEEIAESPQDTATSPGGVTQTTITGLATLASEQRDEFEQLAEDQRDNFEATFASQFAYKRIGNISDYVGDTLQEADKLNSYQYPDDSGEWYGPIQSQSFPITIPANPSNNDEWAITTAATKDWVSGNFSNKNLIKNSTFSIPGTVANAPDATPRSYNANDELFQGFKAVGNLSNVTYVNGKINGTGQIYTDVYKTEKQSLSTSQYVSSIASSDGYADESGALLVDYGDYWRVTFDMNDTFSVKLEMGSKATRHDFSDENSTFVYPNINGTDSDSDNLELMINSNKNGIIIIDQHVYKPTRSVSVGSKVHLKFVNGRDYTGFNVTYPLFVLGEMPGGALPSASVSGIEIENPDCYGDKLAGSRFFHYRKCAGVVMRNPRIWGMEFPITGDGSVGSYESLGCTWENPDFRYCKKGFYDPNGSFQASVFTGTGRIEANDEEGLNLDSLNFDAGDVIIEGNGQETNDSYEVFLGGGGSFKWSGYSEMLPTNTKSSVVGLKDGCTKRIQLNGMDLYAGLGGAVTERAIVNIRNMTTGSVEINGGSASGFTKSVIGSAVTAGNLTVKIDIWDELGNLEPDVDPSVNLTYSNRVAGLRLERLTATVRATINELNATTSNLGVNAKMRSIISRPSGFPSPSNPFDIVSLSELRSVSDKPVRIEVEAVGRTDASSPRQCKLSCVINDAGTVTSSSIVDQGTESSSISLQSTSGTLQVNNLNSFSNWTFYVTGVGWAYSQ